MVVDIGDIETVKLRHAILRSMTVLNQRLKDELDACNPYACDLVWYENFEGELGVLKTFKVLLDKLDALQRQGASDAG